jgi:putative tryptophan/tyrosine transport system substrate-binding protein
MIADLALRHRLPSIAARDDFAKDGGLMSYGPSASDTEGQFRQAASYVDRILRGEKPGALPVQAPTRYSFVISLNTAKELGLTFPLPLIGFADQQIE